MYLVKINKGRLPRRQMFWAERGWAGGVMTAGLEGAGARWLVRRRVRRVAALALDAAARRLYFVDAYYDTLEAVRLDGSGRALVAQFALRPPAAPRAASVYVDGGAPPPPARAPSGSLTAPSWSGV